MKLLILEKLFELFKRAIEKMSLVFAGGIVAVVAIIALLIFTEVFADIVEAIRTWLK